MRIEEKRNTRGVRMTALIGEEAEADQTFWGQNAWKEDEENVDNDFTESSSEEDIEDSDFDISEGEEDDGKEEENAVKSSERNKKRAANVASGGYKEPTVKKQVKTGVKRPRSDSAALLSAAVEVNRSMRESTKERTKETAIQIQAIKALNASMKPAVRKKPPQDRLKHQDMLIEAARTEVENTKELEKMLLNAEEKRRTALPKARVLGPLIKFHSKKGCLNSLTFTEMVDFPKVINDAHEGYPEPQVCVITGLRAKYRDPKTKLYYANLEAYKQLKNKYHNKV